MQKYMFFSFCVVVTNVDAGICSFLLRVVVMDVDARICVHSLYVVIMKVDVGTCILFPLHNSHKCGCNNLCSFSFM